MANVDASRLNLEELQWVIDKCLQEEYQFIVLVNGAQHSSEPVFVTLEKGSQYGDMHMKFSANGTSVKDAFLKAYKNFPQNPINGLWASKQLTHKPDPIEAAVFEEIKNPYAQPPADDIPF